MKKFVASCAMMGVSCAVASAFVVDGINYEPSWTGEPNAVMILGGEGKFSGHLVIPSTVSYEGEEYVVTMINEGSFFYQPELTEVTIPATVKSVHGAFYNCPKLVKVNLPETLETLSGSFQNCGFQELDLTSLSITGECYGNFSSCPDLRKVSADNCSRFGYNFVSCPSLQEAVLGANIGGTDGSFKDSDALRKVCSLAMTPPSGGISVPEQCAVYVPENAVEAYLSDIDWSRIPLLAGADFSQGYDNLPDPRHEVEGVFYTILSKSEKQARAVFGPEGYKGDITVPAKTEIDGVDYEVSGIYYSAFEGSPELKSVNILADIDNLSLSFRGCQTLVALSLPSDLKNIRSLNMDGTAITTFEFPSGLASVGSISFRDCKSLRNIEIPDFMTVIYEGCFSGCEALNEVKLPPTVKEIRQDAFAYCSSLKEIELPVGVMLSNWAFNSAGLEKVVIPAGVTTIGNAAFGGCAQLTEATVGRDVTYVSTAFYQCPALRRINMRPLTPPDMQFYDLDVDNITMYVPVGTAEDYRSRYEDYAPGITYVEDAAMNPWDLEQDGMKFAIISDVEATCGIIQITSEAATLRLPESVVIDGKTYSVTNVKDNSLCNAETLEELTIPASIEKVGNAFRYCKVLRTVILEDADTSLDADFGSGLTKLYVGRNTKAFWSGSDLRELAFSDNVTEVIGFDGCPDIEGLKFPANAQVISGFNNSGLKNPVFPEKVREIGGFYNCAIEELIVPKMCRIVNGFADCKNLRKIVTGKHTNSISGFRNNPSLTEVVFGSGLEVIGEAVLYESPLIGSIISLSPEPPVWYAFGMSENTAVTVPLGAAAKYRADKNWGQFTNIVEADLSDMEDFDEQVDGLCYDLDGDNCTVTFGDTDDQGNVTVPETITVDGQEYGVTEIGAHAFAGSGSIKTIKLPDTVERIGNNAFGGCPNLENVTMGSGTAEISVSAFGGSESITDVYCHADIPPTVSSNFYGRGADGLLFSETVYANATLHVPAGSLADYMNSVHWRDFYTIAGIEGSDVDTITDGTDDFADDTICVYNLSGSKVFEGKLHDVTGLQAGIYIMVSPRQTRKVFINR